MGLKFRRGTTAQKSGSLAFGEPYVNTTLGTLQIGLDTGDVTLASTNGSGIVSGSSQISYVGLSNIPAGIISSSAQIDILFNIDGLFSGSSQVNADTITNFDANVKDKLNAEAVVSGSSQVVGSSITTNTITVGSTAIALGGTATTITGLASVTSDVFAGPLTGNASTATTLQNARTINGTSFNGSTNITIPNLVSGSSQISLGSVTGNSTSNVTEGSNLYYTDARVKTKLDAEGVISGSSQVTISATTGYSTFSSSVDSRITTEKGRVDAILLSADADKDSFAEIVSLINSVDTTNDNSFASFYTASVNRLANIEAASSSYETTGRGIVSGSSQVSGLSNAQLTNSAITIAGQSTSLGGAVTAETIRAAIGTVVTGSGQIQLGSAAGNIALATQTTGDYVASLVAGTNITLSNNSGENATPTIGLTNNSITIAGAATALGGAVTAETIRAAIGAVVTGSAQIDHNSTTNYVANKHIDHTTVTITAGDGLTGGGDISATRTLAIATGGVTNAMLAGSIANDKLSNSAITIAGAATALGGAVTADTIRAAIGAVVTGSAQVSHDSTTGYDANKHIDHTAVSITAGTGLTGGGTIAATRTLAIDSTVATLTGIQTLTNKTISGASNTLSNIANASLSNSSVTVTAGTGMSGGGAVSLGGSVTLTNAGVTSNVAGTGVSVSGATGAVTISIGQSVATNATPTFGNLTINGTITATGDITAYYTSDRRHKNNIQIIPNALAKVTKLNGVTWEWNDDVNEVTKSTPKTGLIAQEVQEVLPEVVTERQDGFLALDYSKMMGLMVEAIKEQQQQIHNLTLEIENLKKQNGL